MHSHALCSIYGQQLTINVEHERRKLLQEQPNRVLLKKRMSKLCAFLTVR